MKYIEPNWPAPANIKAFMTTKLGWGNRPKARERVTPEETMELDNLLHLPNHPVWLNQTHTNKSLEATTNNENAEADASFTRRPNQICVVMTADCLPLLITNRQGTEVAAIHAGWRGLAAGVIESTFANLKSPADELLVWLGPSIGPNKFEVGKDVYDAFTQHNPNASMYFKPHKPDKWFADLHGLAKQRLQTLNVKHVYENDLCTYCNEDLFFSYRREGKTGRMASLIWISG